MQFLFFALKAHEGRTLNSKFSEMKFFLPFRNISQVMLLKVKLFSFAGILKKSSIELSVTKASQSHSTTTSNVILKWGWGLYFTLLKSSCTSHNTVWEQMFANSFSATCLRTQTCHPGIKQNTLVVERYEYNW